MSNLAERLRLERRLETTLNTGRKVGYHLPDIEECILKLGQVSFPAVAALKEPPTEEDAEQIVRDNPAEIERGRRYVRLVVAAMLDDIDGEAIDDTDDRSLITDLLQPSERQELFLIGTQQKDPDSGEA